MKVKHLCAQAMRYPNGDPNQMTSAGDQESALQLRKSKWHVCCSSAWIEKGATEVVVNDGLNSAADASFLPRRMIGWAGMLLFLVNLFAGCSIPVSRATIVPKDVAQTPEQLIGKLDLLKTGMEIGEVYEVLDIKRTTPGVREIVSAEEKQRILYGAAQLVGSSRELELFRNHMSKHRIIEIKFRDIANGLVFDSPVSVLATKAGPDFTSYVVFYEGRLIDSPSKPDNFHHEEVTRVYISDLFGSLFKVGLSRGVSQVGN